MAQVMKLKGSGIHEKSDSEAMGDLEAVFKSVDLDQEGRLDQAAFTTALIALKVQLPEEELEKIFEELDEKSEGFIEYEKLLTFLQMGKIPSSLLNRVKNSKVPRKSVIIGQAKHKDDSNNNHNHNNNKKNGKDNAPLLPPVNQKLIQMQQAQEKMDPQRVKMIQRAVIVIKKAAMKNIPRDEVVEFLMQKQMSKGDIELAYLKAQEQVMNADERASYLQELAETRLLELTEQQKVNKYLTNELTTHTREIDILRNLLRLSTNTLLEKYGYAFNDKCPFNCMDELRLRIDAAKQNITNAQINKDNRAIRVHQRDFETLNSLFQCIQEQKYFHGYLMFHCLDEVIREGMPQLQQFLSNYSHPKSNEQMPYD